MLDTESQPKIYVCGLVAPIPTLKVWQRYYKLANCIVLRMVRLHALDRLGAADLAILSLDGWVSLMKL